jgi:hypothetical protein
MAATFSCCKPPHHMRFAFQQHPILGCKSVLHPKVLIAVGWLLGANAKYPHTTGACKASLLTCELSIRHFDVKIRSQNRKNCHFRYNRNRLCDTQNFPRLPSLLAWFKSPTSCRQPEPGSCECVLVSAWESKPSLIKCSLPLHIFNGRETWQHKRLSVTR